MTRIKIKRIKMYIASFPYKWRRSCHAIDDLPKPGDPAYDEQDVLRGYRSHGGALVDGGQLGEDGGGRDVITQHDGFAAIGEQSAHHGRSSVYEDGKRRDMVIKASLVVKYIAMDVVQKRVVRKCEPAELAMELDMPGEPLSHTMNSETEVRSYYDNKKEEVLAMQDGNSGSFLLPVKKRYKNGQVREIGCKEGKLERRRSLERCRRAASSNLCPGGVLEGVKSLQSSSYFVI